MLEGKTAVVTGTNRGLGKAIAEDFAKNGANLFVCARTKTDEFESWGRKLSESFGVEVHPLYFDLCDAEAMKAAFSEIRSSKKQIDVLANVAGTVFSANFQMTSIDKMKSLFDVNLFSQIQFTQYILKLMTRQKAGSIIFIASSGGIDGNPGRTAYNASKAGVISASQTLAREVGKNGIRVNAIAPGLMDTDMARDNTPEDVMEREITGTCLGRIGKPEELAHVVTFLGSDLASYVTGQVWRVDVAGRHSGSTLRRGDEAQAG